MPFMILHVSQRCGLTVIKKTPGLVMDMAKDHNLDWKLSATVRARADVKYFPFPREDLVSLMDLRVNIFLSHSNYIEYNLIMKVINIYFSFKF